MKKILLIIVGLFLIQGLSSQAYVPFPSDSARWNNLFWHQWSATDISLTNSVYLLEGDTILNGKSYKKVYSFVTDYSYSSAGYIGGLREDNTKNIYFFPTTVNLDTPGPISFPNDTSEHLLYTFDNLEVGMLLPINEDATEIKVLAIDSVLMGDKYRKRYKIQNDALLYIDYWIEGIGSNKDLFSPFTYEFEWEYYTLCFTGSITYYLNSPNGEDSCHYSLPNVGLNEKSSLDFNLYPNPATQTLTIKSGIAKHSVSVNIYSLTGQRVFQNGMLNAALEINVERFEPGIYIVEITDAGTKKYLKFIKK